MIFLNKEKNECVITCSCGCMEGVSIHIDKEDEDFIALNILWILSGILTSTVCFGN